MFLGENIMLSIGALQSNERVPLVGGVFTECQWRSLTVL